MNTPVSTIAVVDDNPLLRESLASLLSLAGHQVLAFGNAADFIAAAEHCRIDCLLLDVEIGADTGFDVAAHPRVKSLGAAVIFMSGSFDPRFPVRAAAAGCIAFLRKPFLASTLLELLTPLHSIPANCQRA